MSTNSGSVSSFRSIVDIFNANRAESINPYIRCIKDNSNTKNVNESLTFWFVFILRRSSESLLNFELSIMQIITENMRNFSMKPTELKWNDTNTLWTLISFHLARILLKAFRMSIECTRPITTIPTFLLYFSLVIICWFYCSTITQQSTKNVSSIFTPVKTVPFFQR